MCAHCRVPYHTYMLRKANLFTSFTNFTQSTFGLRVLERRIIKIVFRIITCVINVIIMGCSVPIIVTVTNIKLQARSFLSFSHRVLRPGRLSFGLKEVTGFDAEVAIWHPNQFDCPTSCNQGRLS